MFPSQGSGVPQMGLMKGIVCPNSGAVEDYMHLVESSVPQPDVPAAFGLPANANRVVNISRAMNSIAGLRRLFVSTSSYGGHANAGDGSAKDGRLVSLLTMLKSAVDHGSMILASFVFTDSQSVSDTPYDAFVSTERRFVHSLLSHMVSRAVAILAGAAPGGVRSRQAKSDCDDLLAGRVPDSWTMGWEDGPMDTPQSWISLVTSRAQFFSKVSAVASNMPAFGFSGIPFDNVFHPEAFLNAMRQAAARKAKCALDNLQFSAGFSQFSPDAYDLGSLWVQGAMVDHGTLADCSADSPAVSRTGEHVFVAWVAQKQSLKDTALGFASVPLYSTASREHLVCELCIPCEGHEQKWTLAGAAFFVHQ
jgi:hypothetical protein